MCVGGGGVFNKHLLNGSFFSSPEPKAQDAIVIGRRPSYINFFLNNHWSKFRIISHVCPP